MKNICVKMPDAYSLINDEPKSAFAKLFEAALMESP